jgi:hypothetical protein
MISIKIQCDCGQRYAFDVEPVGGRMPQAVACPACGADGTAAAEHNLAEQLASRALATAEPCELPPQPLSGSPEDGRAAAGGTERPVGRTGWRRRGLLVAAVAVAAAVVAGVVWDYQKTTPSQTLAGLEGLPRTAAELNAWYAEPLEGQNAALLFLPGLDLIEITLEDRRSPHLPWIGKGTVPPANRPVSAAVRNEANAVLQRNHAALAALPAGVQASGSRYPVDFTELSLPHLFPLLNAVRLASLAAWIAADAGQGDLAGEYLRLGAALVASLEPEPAPISQLNRVACLTPLLEALEQTLSGAALPIDALGRLQAAVDRAAAAESAGVGFTAALLGERAMILEAFQAPPGQLQKRWESILENTPAEALRDLPAQQRAYEQFMADLLLARQEPLPGRLDLNRQRVSVALERAGRQGHSLLEPLLRKGVWEDLPRREAEALARWRLAQTAVALERWRAASNDRYPASLAALVPDYLPAAPSSPFDGQPLRYRPTQSGYELACPAAGSDRITFTVAR